MRRRSLVSRGGILLAVSAVLLAACTGAGTVAEPSGTDATSPSDDGAEGAEPTSTGSVPRPEDTTFQDTAGDACPDGPQGQMAEGNARVEMAFVGTVTAVDGGDPAPWVSFTVDRWFTDDIGVRIGLWAPDFAGQVGDEWLISSTRYGLVTGDVIPCASAPRTIEAFNEWDQRFGGSVQAGAATPEQPADPAIIAQIDEAQAKWQAAGLTTWTALVTFEPRQTTGSPTCGGSIRVVMRDGLVEQAVQPDSGCTVPPGRAATIDRLFLEARRAAGAVVGEVTFDPDFGFITGMYASDRSVEVSLGVSGFVPFAQPLAVEDEDHAAARQQWEASGIRDYTAAITIECFCAITGTFDIEVSGGVVSSLTRREEQGGFGGGGGVDPDPASLTIDGLFEQIAQARATGRAQVAYDPGTGHPVAVYLDPVINAIDDETRYRVDDLTPIA